MQELQRLQGRKIPLFGSKFPTPQSSTVLRQVTSPCQKGLLLSTCGGGHSFQICKSAESNSSEGNSPGGSSSAGKSSGDKYVDVKEFRIEQVSFGSILTPIGLFLLSYGFGSFFQLLPGSSISSIVLIYGFPITLLGFALSYAQLKPVPLKATQAGLDLRDAQSTDIQKQVREDVTRFRYGDEQHLDEALNRIFMFGRQQGIPKRLTPQLRAVREESRDGDYTLVLEFDCRQGMTFDMWTDRQSKIQTFFGPGIRAEITEIKEGRVEVALITDGSGTGRGGPQQRDVLPPLVPGAKARQAR